MFNSAIRSLIRFWASKAIAPGYLYQVCEIWGRKLAKYPVESKLFNGCKVICNLQDHIQRQMYFFGAFEPIESYLVSQLLKPEMTFVDIGANIGNYTLIAAKVVGKSGKVYAFEPVESNFSILSQHTKINNFSSIVKLEKLGVWSKSEVLKFSLYDTEVYDNSTDYIVGEYENAVDTTECLAVSLDDYFLSKDINHIDLIKMDIEGSEYFALEGAIKILEKFRPIILMEINRSNCLTLGYNVDIIGDFFEKLDYQMYQIGGSAESSHILSDLQGVDRVNIFCYHKETTLPTEITNGWNLKSILRHNFNNFYQS